MIYLNFIQFGGDYNLIKRVGEYPAALIRYIPEAKDSNDISESAPEYIKLPVVL
jgi:hypothetical protein